MLRQYFCSIWGCFCKRLAFESVDETERVFTNMGGHHPVNRTTWKGNFALCLSWDKHLKPSNIMLLVLGPWDLDWITHWLPGFSSLQTADHVASHPPQSCAPVPLIHLLSSLSAHTHTHTHIHTHTSCWLCSSLAHSDQKTLISHIGIGGTEICFVAVVFPSLTRVRLFETPWTAACQASLSITISQSLLRLTSIESMMPSNHLVLCCPLLLLPSIFPSIRVFSNESTLHIRCGQRIGALASASVLPMNIQDWFPLGWTGLLSFQSKGLSRVFPRTIAQKRLFFGVQPSLWPNSPIHMRLQEKP